MIAIHSQPIRDYSLGIFDGPHATPAEAEEGPYFLGIKNITEDGRLDFSEPRYVSESEFPRWTKRVQPSPGDVVFTYEATLHRYALIPEGFRGCLGRRVALVRPDPSKVDSRFLLYYFLSAGWRAVVESNVISGATVDRIPLERFPAFPAALPPLPVQRRIADMVASYDALIDNNRRRIKLLEDSVRLLFDEWFVRLRFPGCGGPLGHACVPSGWRWGRCTDVIAVNPRVPPAKNMELWYVPMSALSQVGMTVDRADFERRTEHTAVRFERGDTLFARITPCLENGKTGYVYFLEEGEIACGSTEFVVLRGREVSSYFTYCLARSQAFRDSAIKSMIGSSGRQRVQPSAFDKFELAIPPQGVLAHFDEVAADCFEQVANLARQIERLKKARDLLLPRLMSGELPV